MDVRSKHVGLLKVLLILLVGILFLRPTPTQAATSCTWTGAVSNDWHTANNWDCGVVPGSADTVIIATSSNAPVINANVQITALTVDADAQVTVNASFRLTVSAMLSGSGAVNGLLRLAGCTITVDFAGTVDQLLIETPAGYLCGGVVTFSQDLTVTGDLTLKTATGLYNGQLLVHGNVVSDDTDGYRNYQEVTTIISLVGTADQSISGAGLLMYLNIDKPSGNVVLPQPFSLSSFSDNWGDGALTGSGTILGTLRLVGCNYRVDFAGTVEHLVINMPPGYLCAGTVTFLQDLTVTGDLTLKTATGLYNGQLLVHGNVVSDDTDGYRNYQEVTTVISLVGTADQSISGAGLLMYLNIDKPTGNVVLPQPFSLSSFSDNWGDGALTGSGTILGTLRLVGCNYRVDFAGTVEHLVIQMQEGYLCLGVLTFTQNLSVTDNLTLTNAAGLLSGKLSVGGNIVINDSNYSGAFVETVVQLVGSGAQTISGSGRIHDLELAKPSGAVQFLPGFTTTFNSVLVSLGQWLLLGSDAITAPVTVSGGTLGGTGQINGAVTVNSGGTLTAGHSPGILTINGALMLDSGATFYVEIKGDTPGTQHDQVVVNGTVAINGATLTGTTSAPPTNNIILIANDGTDQIGGARFAGATTNGSTVLIGGQAYSINYNGGTGNDVAFTALSPEINVTGNNGAIANGDATPSASDHTDFGALNVASGTVVRTFTIQNNGNRALTGVAATVNGNAAFTLSSTPVVTVSAGSTTTFQVSFAPSTAGVVTATVSIASNDADENPYTFVVVGEGVTPPPQATLTVVLDAEPNAPIDLGFGGSFGTFYLDDPAVDDSDSYTNTRTFTIPPGAYHLQRFSSPNWYTTAIVCTPSSGATVSLPLRRVNLTLVDGDAVTCTFTVDRAVTIRARAFNDLVRNNANGGKRNAGDPWLENWTMSVFTAPGALVTSGVTSATSTSGLYEATFRNLRSGSYVVCVTLPDAAWSPTAPAVDGAYGQPCTAVTLAPGQAGTLAFGAYQPIVAASETFTIADEVITDEDRIVDVPIDPTEVEIILDETMAPRLYLPLIQR